jgi:lactoylglutathione lyase
VTVQCGTGCVLKRSRRGYIRVSRPTDGMGMGPEKRFSHTGLRVEDIDKAIEFFTKVLGMKLRSRVEATWNKGVFANLGYEGDQHYLELRWHARDSPFYTTFVEGDQLDHLGIKVRGFDGTLRSLADAGYSVKIGPIHEDKWHIAFVRGYEGLWLDIYSVEDDRNQQGHREVNAAGAATCLCRRSQLPSPVWRWPRHPSVSVTPRRP